MTGNRLRQNARAESVRSRAEYTSTKPVRAKNTSRPNCNSMRTAAQGRLAGGSVKAMAWTPITAANVSRRTMSTWWRCPRPAPTPRSGAGAGAGAGAGVGVATIVIGATIETPPHDPVGCFWQSSVNGPA